MFRPLALFIGLRYTRAKRRNHFISFISLTSMLGIALGVTVLITVLSVMNGFDDQIKERIFTMAPQVTVHDNDDRISNWQTMAKRIRQVSEVQAVAPFVGGQGMLVRAGAVRGIIVSGILPNAESQLSNIDQSMVEGRMSDLKPGRFSMMIGENLAASLGVMVGDQVTLVTPKSSLTPVGIIPRYKRFKISGIFHAGNGFGFDSQLAFINLEDAQALYQLPHTVSGFHIKINDLYAAPQVSQELIEQLPKQLYVSDWTETYGPLFKAIKLEKNMMFLILLLIVAVAAFNLVATLVMVVNDKRSDIAILRTMGSTPRQIMAIFIVQGFVVGLTGTLLGLAGGISLASNVTPIVSWLQDVFHLQLLSSSVYYIDYLPSRIDSTDILQITVAAFVMSLVATLYPAWRASKTEPAEALRYE